MSTTNLEAAVASTRAVLANITPAQLSDATPCAEWSVSDLINHVVGGQFFFSGVLNGSTPSGDAPNFASGDFLAAFDESAAATIAGFSRPGVMETTYDLPFGSLPGSAFVNVVTSDTFTHGWDLAKATGQDTDLAPELSAQLLAGMRSTLPDALRNPSGNPFGPEQTAPDSSSNADKLAAFLGRSV